MQSARNTGATAGSFFKGLAVTGAVLAACGLMPSAAAACTGNTSPNLVKNAGFETGNFTDWTVAWPSSADPNVNVNTIYPYAGHYSAQMGSATGLNSLSQTIGGTTAGSVYSVCFVLANTHGGSDGTPSLFEVRWNGQPVLTLVDQLPFAYRLFQISVRATGTDTLRFDEQNINEYWYLDNVFVQAGGTTPFVTSNGPKHPN